MSECPHCKPTGQPVMRPDLPRPLPRRMLSLPIGKNGYPIPWFVAEINGSREDFRIADPGKVRQCIDRHLCWVCGQPCGVHLAFVIGPMCTVNRLSADPFSHLECAEYSVKSCPFMLRPHMVRREDERTEAMEENVGGVMIKRNPGVMAIWVTKSYSAEVDEHGCLFRLDAPEAITWWREGRPATRAEIEESINSGLPILREMCRTPDENKKLDEAIKRARTLLPAR